MTVRSVAPLGAPTWMDLTTADMNRATDFYGAVFGWSFEVGGPEYGGYVTASVDGRPVAGLMTAECPDGRNTWTTYLATDDVNATLALSTAAGGTTRMAAMEVPAQGWMAVVSDPTGAPFGLWQPLGHLGFQAYGEAGAPIWHQLTTRDYAKALDFYGAVFGWKTQIESDTADFRYSTALFDGEQLLGVMDGSVLPAEMTSQWNVFLGADDVDKTLRVIVDNGGAVLRDAEDTPYGRLAAAADPSGAPFNVSSV